MKIIATNRKARHNYFIEDTIEVGIALRGDEVKSVRNGRVSLDESYATIHDTNLTLLNCYIAPYSHSRATEEESRRSRRLLAHKKEISKLIGLIARKGYTLIPLKMYLNNRGLVKLELGLAKHKHAHSRKQELKERDIKRQTERESKFKIS